MNTMPIPVATSLLIGFYVLCILVGFRYWFVHNKWSKLKRVLESKHRPGSVVLFSPGIEEVLSMRNFAFTLGISGVMLTLLFISFEISALWTFPAVILTLWVRTWMYKNSTAL